MSKQTLYVYYQSKEELFVDVMGQLIYENPQNQLQVDEGSIETLEEVRRTLSGLSRGLVANLMQPDYLGLIRVVIAETPRLPQLGLLFRSELPERVLGNISAILQVAREGGIIGAVDADAASRMLVGALLTYAIYDGLLVGDGPPQPPNPEHIEGMVDLFMKAIS